MVSIYLRFKILILGLLYSLGLWLILTVIFRLELFRDFRSRFDGWIYDNLSRSTLALKPFDKLIIIDVNDPDQRTSRAKYARLIRKLDSADVKVMGFDLLFYGNKDPKADNELINAVKQSADKIVLAYMFVGGEKKASIAELGKHDMLKLISPMSGDSANFHGELENYYWDEFYEFKDAWLPFNQLLTTDSKMSLGHITYLADYDGRIREFPLVLKYGDGYYPALALEIVKKYLNASYLFLQQNKPLALQTEDGEKFTVPLDRYGQVLMKLIHPDDFSYESFAAIVDSDQDISFIDKICLIVNSNPDDEKTDATYFQEKLYPKWAFHASLISQILKQWFIEVDPKDTFVWAEM